MKKLFLFSIMSLLLVSCNDDEVVGPFGATQTIVGFDKAAVSANFFNDVPEATAPVPVQLVAFSNETFPTDVVVNWVIDEAASTAVEGTHYSSATSGTVTIPSGSTVSNILLTVYPVNLDPDFPKTVVFNLTTVSSANAVVGSQYSTAVVTLQGVCPTDLGGAYTITYTSGTFPVNITDLGNGRYYADRAPAFTTAYWFEFSDVCGTIVIDNTWAFAASNPMSGGGMVNGDGSITFTGYTVGGTSVSNRTYTIYPL